MAFLSWTNNFQRLLDWVMAVPKSDHEVVLALSAFTSSLSAAIATRQHDHCNAGPLGVYASLLRCPRKTCEALAEGGRKDGSASRMECRCDAGGCIVESEWHRFEVAQSKLNSLWILREVDERAPSCILRKSEQCPGTDGEHISRIKLLLVKIKSSLQEGSVFLRPDTVAAQFWQQCGICGTCNTWVTPCFFLKWTSNWR